MLTLTPKAAEKIKDFLKTEESVKGKSLRLKVAPSGCAGYEYKIAFDDKVASDKILPQNGFDVDHRSRELPARRVGHDRLRRRRDQLRLPHQEPHGKGLLRLRQVQAVLEDMSLSIALLCRARRVEA